MLRGMFREFIREKKRQLGIPEGLLEELTPVPARDLEVVCFLPEEERRSISIGLMPVNIVWGSAYGPVAGQWYRVTFPKPIGGNPHVVAVAEGKSGEITSRVVDKVIIRTYHCRACDMGFFTIVAARRCPSCGSYDIEEITGADRYERTGWYLALWNAKRHLGDWGIFNWMRDAIATLIAWLGYYLFSGNGAFILADALSAQVDRISEAITERLRDLYKMWGIPTNMAIAPVHVRNVTSTGFEFLSLGDMKIHFIAIGRKTLL